jgi:hypothetical protein
MLIHLIPVSCNQGSEVKEVERRKVVEREQ